MASRLLRSRRDMRTELSASSYSLKRREPFSWLAKEGHRRLTVDRKLSLHGVGAHLLPRKLLCIVVHVLEVGLS